MMSRQDYYESLAKKKWKMDYGGFLEEEDFNYCVCQNWSCRKVIYCSFLLATQAAGLIFPST